MPRGLWPPDFRFSSDIAAATTAPPKALPVLFAGVQKWNTKDGNDRPKRSLFPFEKLYLSPILVGPNLAKKGYVDDFSYLHFRFRT
jgi:hypothetical protein